MKASLRHHRAPSSPIAPPDNSPEGNMTVVHRPPSAPPERDATRGPKPETRGITEPGGGPGRPGISSWRVRLARLDIKATPYGLVAPFFLIFLAFGLFPLVYTAFVSLHKWSLLSPHHTWVGAHNYRKLVADHYFWNALFNTLSIWIISTVPTIALALGLAHLLNTRIRSRRLFRMGVLLPNVTSVVAVAVIFSQLFGHDFGLFNWLLSVVHIGRVDWQAGRLTSHLAIATMIMWRWTGYNSLIFLAAMQAIPGELYESARIDGASSFQQLRHVTVPMLRATIVFVVIMSTIGGLQLFAEPLLFGGSGATGGTARQFQTLAMYLYEKGFRHFDFGYASAIAWVVFLLIAVISVINLTLVRRIRSAS
jgi:cellobiose transport system permease protein